MSQFYKEQQKEKSVVVSDYAKLTTYPTSSIVSEPVSDPNSFPFFIQSEKHLVDDMYTLL